MSETNNIPPFKDHFENLEITIHKLRIEKFHSLTDKLGRDIVPYSNVWENVKTFDYKSYIVISGEIFLMVKSQGAGHTLVLFLIVELNVNAIGDKLASNTFCKILQYLFKWIGKYVRDNNICENNGNEFNTPDFLYSQSMFEDKLPPFGS